MADNRKYYYLKLKESYFDEDAIVLLESMQDGMLYSNILLKLYLKSLKNGGKLQLDENIPYTAPMIATITRQQVGTVERALQIFMKLGLVEPLQNGALYMSNIELLIGQSSTEGERKRRARRALQEQNALPEAVADKRPPYGADICPPEIEIEKEIDIELEIKREGEIKTGQTAPAPFGRYENVFLSEKELAELSDYDNAIFRLATAQEAEPEDYTGEDGLLYCGSCRQPKEAYFPEGKTFFGRDRHPKECDCQRKRRETLEANHREQKHREEVERLKRKGFTDPAMKSWTFGNDNGKCPQMAKAHAYVEQWEQIKDGNHVVFYILAQEHGFFYRNNSDKPY